MIYGAILAGGIGSRVTLSHIPKQFICLEGRPVIAYTIESMLAVRRFDEIYIACHAEWMTYLEELIAREFSSIEGCRILLTTGGKERIDSIRNVTDAIEREHPIGEDDILVIHDAARPFVTKQILQDSIDSAARFGAVVAALPASDTMLYSEEGEQVDHIPDRKKIYHGQAPDSFRLKLFLDMQAALTEEQRALATGTSLICTMNHVTMHMVPGDSLNFKITTDSDVVMAENIVHMLKKK